MAMLLGCRRVRRRAIARPAPRGSWCPFPRSQRIRLRVGVATRHQSKLVRGNYKWVGGNPKTVSASGSQTGLFHRSLGRTALDK
jgi:ribosomal protein L37E